MKSKAILLAILSIIACGALFSTTVWMKPSGSRASQSDERPEVIIKQGQNLPLEIISIKPDAVTFEKPIIKFTVANRGFQPIIAYAVRFDTVSSSSKAGGHILISAPSMGKALQPGQEATETVGDDVTYSDPIRKVYLYIDYVQLADGAEMGPDKSKASEILAGQRAGARSFASQIRSLLKKKDAANIMGLIDREDFGPTPPPEATPQWVTGFRSGIGILKGRLKDAYQRKGAGDFEIELNKPFDASAER